MTTRSGFLPKSGRLGLPANAGKEAPPHDPHAPNRVSRVRFDGCALDRGTIGSGANESSNANRNTSQEPAKISGAGQASNDGTGSDARGARGSGVRGEPRPG